VLTRACVANIENPVDITHDGTRASARGRGEEGGRMMKFRWTGKGDEEQEEELKKTKKQQHITTISRDGSVGELIKSVLWLFKCHVVSVW